MLRSAREIAPFLMMAVSGLGACASPAGAPAPATPATGAGTHPVALTPPETPPSIRPPSGETLFLQTSAKGVQIYECAQEGAAYAWKLKAPEAELLDPDGKKVGMHSAGPSWSRPTEARWSGN
jgi:hypothetical protein